MANPVITATAAKLGIRLGLTTPPSMGGDQVFNKWQYSLDGGPHTDLPNDGGDPNSLSGDSPFAVAAGTHTFQLFALFDDGDEDAGGTLSSNLVTGIAVQDFAVVESLVPAIKITVPATPAGYSSIQLYDNGSLIFDSGDDHRQGDAGFWYRLGAGSHSLTWLLVDSSSGLASADGTPVVVHVPNRVGASGGPHYV